MSAHEEGHIRFEFDDSKWPAVIKWDDHPAYRDGLQRMHGTAAVDFVALHILGPCLIEVKDFRGHRIENRGRVGENLALEVAAKVRDTLAALLWAQDRDGLERREEVTSHLKALLNRDERDRPTQVLVWLDQDGPFDQAVASALGEQIKLRLKPWLKVKVFVTGISVWSGEDLVATNLPGAGRPP